MYPSHDPTYPLFPIFSFLGFVLSLMPLPWHIQAWNSGTCAFMIWTGMTCLIEFVNALVWRGNVDNVAPVWCDISSKLILGVSIGIPAATLCISRRLYGITSVQTVSVTREDKRRMIVGDLCIAVGIPVLIMTLHVVVQAHRFDILEDIGCFPVVYNTLPAYFLYFMWPIALGLVSLMYSGLTLRSFWRRRAQFNQLLSSNSSMNPSRYLRLMLLAFFDIMLTVPLAIYSIYISTHGVGLAPWVSWEETHFNFGRVAQVPAIFWRSDRSFQISVELTRWLPVFCAFLFFGLFGFATEARKQYVLAFWGVAKQFGFKRPGASTTAKASLPGWNKAPSSNITPQGSLPAYTAKSPAFKKHHANDSLSSSLAGDDHELDTYISTDVEKSAGLPSPAPSSAPPEYYHSRQYNLDIYPSSPQSPRTYLESKPSNHTLRSTNTRDSFYVHDDHIAARSPTPAPFSDVAVPPFPRPLTLSNGRPTIPSHTTAQSLDVIHVTVHTQSSQDP